MAAPRQAAATIATVIGTVRERFRSASRAAMRSVHGSREAERASPCNTVGINNRTPTISMIPASTTTMPSAGTQRFSARTVGMLIPTAVAMTRNSSAVPTRMAPATRTGVDSPRRSRAPPLIAAQASCAATVRAGIQAATTETTTPITTVARMIHHGMLGGSKTSSRTRPTAQSA